jgi:hypothetical protein
VPLWEPTPPPARGHGPYPGYYVLEVDDIGQMNSVFSPATTDVSKAARFVIYDSGNNNIQVQAQYRNQWMGDASGGPWALSDPYAIQYSGAFGGTVQLLHASASSWSPTKRRRPGQVTAPVGVGRVADEIGALPLI